jgi:hypothetical protein
MRLACDKLKVNADLFCNESADIVHGKAFAQRRVKRCQATDGDDEAPRFGTCTPQRANQCVRKCDSDLKILECGIGITAILFRGRSKITSNARASTPKSLMSKAALLTPRFKFGLRLALQTQPSILYAKKAAVVPTMSKMRLIMPRVVA